MRFKGFVCRDVHIFRMNWYTRPIIETHTHTPRQASKTPFAGTAVRDLVVVVILQRCMFCVLSRENRLTRKNENFHSFTRLAVVYHIHTTHHLWPSSVYTIFFQHKLLVYKRAITELPSDDDGDDCQGQSSWSKLDTHKMPDINQATNQKNSYSCSLSRRIPFYHLCMCVW